MVKHQQAGGCAWSTSGQVGVTCEMYLEQWAEFGFYSKSENDILTYIFKLCLPCSKYNLVMARREMEDSRRM